MSTLNPPETELRRERPVAIAPSAVVLAVTLAGFLALAVLVITEWRPLANLDHSLVLDAHRAVLASPVLLQAAKSTTAVGSPLTLNLIVAAAGVVLLLRHRIRASLCVIAVRIVELGVATAGKDGIARPRPTFPDPVSHASSFSFPSGHAAGAAAVFGALLALTGTPMSKRTASLCGITVVILVAAVSTSRVLLGVHYPSDVLAGALLGVACVAAARPFAMKGRTSS